MGGGGGGGGGGEGGGGERREQVRLGGVSLIFQVCTDRERGGQETDQLQLQGNVVVVEALLISPPVPLYDIFPVFFSPMSSCISLLSRILTTHWLR